MLEEMYIRGIEVNYYFVCKTKIWFFSHNINLEKESDLVRLGKLIHRQFFERDEKDVQIGPIAIDVVKYGDWIEIREVKKSDSMEKADFYQVAYYIYYLSKYGITAKGKITYPKNKKVVEVELNEELEREIEDVLKEIAKIKKSGIPKVEKKKQCNNCAYYEFCFT